MNIDHLRSNGYIAQVERQPKRVDYSQLLALGRELLLAIGEDPDREGLRETPRRWADAWHDRDDVCLGVLRPVGMCVRHTGRIAL